MTETAPFTLTERFSSLIEGLQKDVAGSVVWGLFPIPLMKLLWRRLCHMRARFNAILAGFRAGMLAAGRLAAPGAARRRVAPERPAASSRPADRLRPLELPRRVGWVIQPISMDLSRRDELEEILADPEMAAIFAGAPQIGGVLRPLCRMLAVKVPAWLKLPRRARRRVVVEHPPAPDWLVAEPGAELRADGSVWMHLGASTHWKPGCGQALKQAQKFDPPVRIWPRDD